MNDEIVAKFFDSGAAEGYDERARRIGTINDNLHFLIRLILEPLPADARILCVGVGTGMEIVRLARVFPGWSFTGVDPSRAMLELCRARVRDEGLASRCELIHGYVDDVAGAPRFDAALCLLVAHFLRGGARQALFDAMARRLKPNGLLINAEISFDLAAPEFGDMLGQWRALHRAAGASEDGLAGLERQLRDIVAVLPPAATGQLLRNSGFPLPVEFFQSLLIRAWYARRDA